MAWHYKDYQRDQSSEDRETYSRAEVSARQMKVGLWIVTSPFEPSKFRRMKIGSTSGSDAERLIFSLQA
jgi:endonuclease YncB( thermonuclease family)